MSLEDIKTLLTPSGDLLLKDKNIEHFPKTLLSELGLKISHIDLRNNKITYIDGSCFQTLSLLQSLDLRNNNLEHLPDKLTPLKSLQALRLDHNHLTTLPFSLFKLPLEMLTISKNSLFTLSPQITELTNLSMLSISENQIKFLPTDIGQLKQLTLLHLHKNEFTTIPLSFAGLENLEDFSLEWFKYIVPNTCRVIKGHVGFPIISSLRDLCLRKLQEGYQELPLTEFLLHFSEPEFHIDKIKGQSYTSLQLSALNGDIGVVSALIGSGCDLNVLDSDGYSALGLALREDNIKAAALLVEAGARLDIGSGSFGSIINLAVVKSEPWLIKTLIRSGIDINLADKDGNTCLHHLMTVFKKNKHKNTLIADLIVDAGIKVNAMNNDKWAAVHIAARKGQNSALRWILKKNKETEAIKVERFKLNMAGGSHGWTPLHLASHSGHYNTVEILVEAGAQAFVKNLDGQTPRDTAKGDITIYKYLSRVERLNISLFVQQKSYKSETFRLDNPQERTVYKKYQKLYKHFANKDYENLENLSKHECNIVIRNDEEYLLSHLTKENRGVLGEIINREIPVGSSLKIIDSKIGNGSIGPKLSRSNPLQKSLPVNISTYAEEDTRIDTLTIA